MSKTNCINCGAGKEVSDIQCPFCGTRYADLTTFNLMSDEPIYIQFSKGGKVITAKAYITTRKIEIEPYEMSGRNIDGTIYRKRFGTEISGTIGFALYESI